MFTRIADKTGIGGNRRKEFLGPSEMKGFFCAMPLYLDLCLDHLYIWWTEIIFTGQRITLKDWSVKDRSPKDHSGDIFKAIEKVKAGVQQAMRRLEADEKPVTPYTAKKGIPILYTLANLTN